MLRIEFENEDSIVSITTKNADTITWIDMILHFADTLNGATYVIDKEVLEAHLEAAADEMRQEAYRRIAAQNECRVDNGLNPIPTWPNDEAPF